MSEYPNLHKLLICRSLLDDPAVQSLMDVLDGDNAERRWKFYADLGFRPLGDPDNPRRVFIPMADVRASLAED